MNGQARDLDAGVRAGRRRALGVLSYIAACVLGIATAIYAVLLFDLDGNLFVRALILSALLIAAGLLFAIAEGFFVPSVRDVLARDARPPVVYLRPFDEDREVVYDVISSGETTSVETAKAEDFLLSLNAIGPLVSIAAPDWAAHIGLHPHGAYRDFVGGGDWQARVQQLLERAGLVVLAIGDSPGIEWEIAQARERIGAEGLLVYLPPRPVGAWTKKGRQRRERELYEGLTPLVEKHFGVQMPAFSAATYVIGFRPDGSPLLPQADGPRGWFSTERGRVANTVRAQLVSVLGQVRPDVRLERYRLHGRRAMWTRLAVGALLSLAALGAALGAVWDGGSTGLARFSGYVDIASQSLPGMLLTGGWLLLARYFRRAWVWLVPVCVGLLTVLHATQLVLLFEFRKVIDVQHLVAWFGAAGFVLQLVSAATVLALGVALLRRRPPSTRPSR